MPLSADDVAVGPCAREACGYSTFIVAFIYSRFVS